uniref:BTB domain-containing protein n=2 Tax=Caenorhabditis tropicalis TaxID=1561998 RepID=A0A1I7TCL2_9PELO
MSEEPTEKKARTNTLMDFSDPDPNLHDVVLVVEGQKFYCLRAILARHSEYFYSLFFKDFKEKDEKEVELKDPPNPEVFQEFLEIFHGDIPRNEELLEDVLILSGLWQCDLVTQRCVDYLKRDANMSLKAQFQLAMDCKLDELKKAILDDVMMSSELHDIVPDDIMTMDHQTMGMVLKRSLELQPAVRREDPRDRSPPPRFGDDLLRPHEMMERMERHYAGRRNDVRRRFRNYHNN